MTLTETECTELGQAVLRNEKVGCPRCNALLETKRQRILGARTERVFLFCKYCREDGFFLPEAVADAWTDEQMQAIALAYRRDNEARCPEDLAILSVAQGTGGRLSILCPLCGRTGDA